MSTFNGTLNDDTGREFLVWLSKSTISIAVTVDGDFSKNQAVVTITAHDAGEVFSKVREMYMGASHTPTLVDVSRTSGRRKSKLQTATSLQST